MSKPGSISIFKKKINSDLVFFIILLIISLFYYDSVMDKGPLNTHLWRQTDCLSFSRNYMNGASFMQPEMDVLLADQNTTGKTAGELPVLYYTMGQIWRVIGESYMSYRIFYLLILVAGLIAFYKSLETLFADSFWAIVLAFLLFTSPVYIVYGVSFLTDGPAFSFVLIALYFLLQYHLKKRQALFYWSMAFFALGGLLKVSSLIAFLFLFGILVLETVFRVKSLGDKKMFRVSWREWLGFLSVMLILFAWYAYAAYYNDLHGFKYTFNNIHPIWLIENGDYEPVINGVKKFTSRVFFSRPILYLLLFGCIFNLFLFRKVPPMAYLSSVIITLGGIIYFLLWTPLLGYHDYYYIALLILFPGILLPLAWYVKTSFPRFFYGNTMKVLMGAFLLYNFVYAFSVVRLKTVARDGEFAIVGDSDFVGDMRWLNWDVGANWMRYSEMKPYMEELGIAKNDRVICLSDWSFNTALYLMDKRGWSNYMNYDSPEDFEFLISKGAKYLIISDPKQAKQDFLKPFVQDSIGNYRGVVIYKLPDVQATD